MHAEPTVEAPSRRRIPSPGTRSPMEQMFPRTSQYLLRRGNPPFGEPTTALGRRLGIAL